MTPQAYEQMWLLFEEARRRDPAQRQAFLDERCAGDPDLRAEVGKLLARAEAGAATAFLQEPCPLGVKPHLAGPPDDSLIGRRIGPYEVKALIASGGMGSVYRAERTRDYAQQVAVKLIRPGLANEEILRRFLEERQVLAGLRHPNIARLLDGGSLEDRPYFIMEYIEGVPIDRYCQDRQLSTAERLELFRAVCAAVHYAHQNLVLHRDLKPGNILVDGAGVPKLVDFGIAKLLHPAWSSAAARTRTGDLLLTPEYASPEQLRGDTLPGTAGDVYALGVVLYELLTGHRPHEAGPDQSLWAFARTVCDEEPAPPRRWRPELPHDLEVICLKCLHKEPHRRYVSAEALAEELGRFLAGEPIQARPVGVWERGIKWARRRPAVAALLGVLVVAAGSLLAGGLWYQARLQRALTEATANKARAEENVAFALGLIAKMSEREVERARSRPGMQLTLRQSLKEACDAYEKLLAMNHTDDPPMLLRMGLAYRQLASLHYVVLGEDEEGMAACNRALELLRQLAAAFPNEPRYRHELAGSFQLRANIRRHQGDQQEADRDYRAALTLHRQLWEEQPQDPRYRDALARHYHNLASLLGGVEWPKEAAQRDPARLAETKVYLVTALEHHRELAAAYPQKYAYRQALASDQHALGSFLARSEANRSYPGGLRAGAASGLGFLGSPQGQGPLLAATALFPGRADAEILYREALHRFEQLREENRENTADCEHRLGRVYHDLGSLLRRNEDWPGAQDAFREAIRLHAKLWAESPDVPDYGYELARHYRELGNLLGQIARRQRAEEPYRQAQEAYQQARALFAKLADDYPQRPTYRGELGITLVRFGKLLLSRNNLTKARGGWGQAFERLRWLKARGWLAEGVGHLHFVLTPGLKVKHPDSYHRALRDGDTALAGSRRPASLPAPPQDRP